MPEQFLHGVEVVQIDNGPRPISTARASVIGIVGTAPDADAAKFPLNTPVLVAGRRSEAAPLGTAGTLPPSIDDIFDQAGAIIVVIRVEEGADDAATMANVIGGVDVDGQYEGLQALRAAESMVGVTPRILIAPGFTQNLAVATEMVAIANRLRAFMFFDGPNSTDADAIVYRGDFGTKRAMVIDPWVKVFDTVTETEIVRPPSARAAGMLVLSDQERGFWWSPSNRVMSGITGTARPVDFSLGDNTSRANILNENEVATIIRQDGFRLWGNRTCSTDPKWAFINVVRTADLIAESILQAHLWAVDRNITKTYLEGVLEGVNAYMRRLKAQGAIINGEAYADPELNTADSIAAGKVFIDFRFSANYPAEHITFRSHLVNDYLTEVLPEAA